MGQVLEAKESFTTELDGKKIHVVAGATRVDENHDLAKRFSQHFKPIEASFGVEAATDTPGEVRARVANAVAAEASASAEGSSEGTPPSGSSDAAGASGTAPETASRSKRSTPAK